MNESEEINISNEVNSDESDSDELILTAAQVIQIMEEAWSNEKFAPEILPHKYEIVECILGQISHVEENLSNLINDDLRRSIHQMELDRLRYLVSSYLRTRLEKIEAFVCCILKEEDERASRNKLSYLSPSELEFAKAYRDGLDQHFTDTLKLLPAEILNNKIWQNEIITPNLDAFVFAKAKSQIEGVMIERDEEFVDLEKGSQVIISYSNISNLITNDKVSLI
ncbi:hypothetical protein RN001_007243 [Aquatica leii]|uniref:DNA replication complex GINS protein SLD5 n=1 Tax=Aquatica leii TaxID=1421715 RepID=A0AAN7PXY4_9COLE|nr:hypothetical protein RN001_007243 [Aquatica leii]